MKSEIIIVSDTHRFSGYLTDLETAYPQADLYLHLGDLQDDPSRFPKWKFVRGNTDDFFPGKLMPSIRIVEQNGIRILMTHSHRFSQASRNEELVRLANENNCSVVLYGHTHVPAMKKEQGIWLINPGSPSIPRNQSRPCYGRIVIEDGEVKPELIRKEKWPFKRISRTE